MFKNLIKRSCASAIVCHNNPSGHTAPSPEDIQVTQRLMEAGQIVGIDIIDHLIIGFESYISLKEKGYMVYLNNQEKSLSEKINKLEHEINSVTSKSLLNVEVIQQVLKSFMKLFHSSNTNQQKLLLH